MECQYKIWENNSFWSSDTPQKCILGGTKMCSVRFYQIHLYRFLVWHSNVKWLQNQNIFLLSSICIYIALAISGLLCEQQTSVKCQYQSQCNYQYLQDNTENTYFQSLLIHVDFSWTCSGWIDCIHFMTLIVLTIFLLYKQLFIVF